MKSFNDYQSAENYLIGMMTGPESIGLSDNRECLCLGFVLNDPSENRNNRSNYEYAQAFYDWLKSGKKQLSEEILRLNPIAKKFVDPTGLPQSFSTSYGWKIHEQLVKVLKELETPESRRAYINILYESDKIVLGTKSTHEYPCTVGIHFLVRRGKLNAIVHMRSNNVWEVLPYDVFNFTNLQIDIAKSLGIPVGTYTHFMDSAHIYHRSFDKVREYFRNQMNQLK